MRNNAEFPIYSFLSGFVSYGLAQVFFALACWGVADATSRFDVAAGHRWMHVLTTATFTATRHSLDVSKQIATAPCQACGYVGLRYAGLRYAGLHDVSWVSRAVLEVATVEAVAECCWAVGRVPTVHVYS